MTSGTNSPDEPIFMKNTITAIKRGVKAAMEETLLPRQFQISGKQVVCSLCGSDGFQWHGHGMAGTRYKAFHRGLCSSVLPVQSFGVLWEKSRRAVKGETNKTMHANRRPAFWFHHVGFFRYWNGSHRPFPVAVADLHRSAKNTSHE